MMRTYKFYANLQTAKKKMVKRKMESSSGNLKVETGISLFSILYFPEPLANFHSTDFKSVHSSSRLAGLALCSQSLHNLFSAFNMPPSTRTLFHKFYSYFFFICPVSNRYFFIYPMLTAIAMPNSVV